MKRICTLHPGFALLLGILICHPILAQEPDELEHLHKLCKSTACHPAGAVRVNLANGDVLTVHSEYPVPIVQGDLIAVYPGTSFLIGGEVEEGIIVGLRVIDDSDSPQNAVRIRMWQESGKPDTFLAVTNYFPAFVKYRAGMMLPDGDDIHETSTCTVIGNGGHGYEHWPYPIFQLLLDRFRVISTASTITCE